MFDFRNIPNALLSHYIRPSLPNRTESEVVTPQPVQRVPDAVTRGPFNALGYGTGVLVDGAQQAAAQGIRGAILANQFKNRVANSAAQGIISAAGATADGYNEQQGNNIRTMDQVTGALSRGPVYDPAAQVSAGALTMDQATASAPRGAIGAPGVLSADQIVNTADQAEADVAAAAGVASQQPGTRSSAMDPNSAVAGAEAKTGNARGSQMGMGFRPGDLTRIGLAMIGNSGAGLTSAMGAAGQTLGQVQNERRAEEEAARLAAERKEEAELERQQAIEIARARASQQSSASQEDREKAIMDTQNTMFSYQQAMTALIEAEEAGGNLTGIGGMAKSWIDALTGNDDAARRLILERVKVDDALLRVANTKGAISNKEMQLFLAPAPKNWQDEATWKKWLEERYDAAQNVLNRLQNNVVLPESERFGRLDGLSLEASIRLTRQDLEDNNQAAPVSAEDTLLSDADAIVG